jgi:hypothetical protein
MSGRAPGPLRPIGSARQTGHQRVSVLCVRKPPKSPGFRETAGGGAPHLHRACRIRNESFGQSSIEQEAADALEPGGGPVSVASPRRAAKRHVDRRLPCGESAFSWHVWICASGALMGPHPHLRSTPRFKGCRQIQLSLTLRPRVKMSGGQRWLLQSFLCCPRRIRTPSHCRAASMASNCKFCDGPRYDRLRAAYRELGADRAVPNECHAVVIASVRHP